MSPYVFIINMFNKKKSCNNNLNDKIIVNDRNIMYDLNIEIYGHCE